ncbi:hypothetical protein D3C79_769790 [compost metagenome]
MRRAVLPGGADRQKSRYRLAGCDIPAGGDGGDCCRYRPGAGGRGGQHGGPAAGRRHQCGYHYRDHITGDIGRDHPGFCAVPRFSGDNPDPDWRAGGVWAVVLYGRGGFDANPRGALVCAADLLHPAF